VKDEANSGNVETDLAASSRFVIGENDASASAHFHLGRVEPDIRLVAFHRATEKRFDLVVDLFAQPTDLALGDAVHPHGLNPLVDRAGRDAPDIRLLHKRDYGFLRHAARLEEARKVGAPARLGNALPCLTSAFYVTTPCREGRLIEHVAAGNARPRFPRQASHQSFARASGPDQVGVA